MAWVLTRALAGLFAAFDLRFPGRDRTTDGAVGNDEHAERVSGHNPDDTPGVRAEYSDADSKPEVRSIDVDNGLDGQGAGTMRAVIAAILATPADRARLKYVIYETTIWSRNTNWEPHPYTGTPHWGHAHFSGDPLFDESTDVWQSVINFGGMMANDLDQFVAPLGAVRENSYMAYHLGRAILGLHEPAHGHWGDEDQPEPNKLAALLNRIDSKLDAVVARLDQVAPAGGVAEHEHMPGAVVRPDA